MGSPIDLTLLQNVKDWIYGNSASSPSPVVDDAILRRLITQASQFVLSQLQRQTLFYHSITELRSGVGTPSMTLREFPVLSISQVMVGNQLIPPRPPLSGSATPVITFSGAQPGWSFEPWNGYPPGRPQAVTLSSYRYPRDFNNIQFNYTAGYVVQGEVQTIPAAAPYTIQPLMPMGAWAGDVGVSYVGGVALVPVTSAPTAGQYVPPTDPNDNPVYTFAAADAGRPVALSYSFAPADLSYAVCKWVGEAFTYKSRIGLKSKILAQHETMTYQLTAMPDDVKLILNPYKNQLPI